MNELMLFTDGSVNTSSKTGYGAYLLLPQGSHSPDLIKSKVKVKRFEQTSSTKLELQTLLWALQDKAVAGAKLTAYTDSQNILSLGARRARFEDNDYYSKNNKRLKNFELYQEFFRLTDKLTCEFIKLRGHKSSSEKNDIDQLFTLVDRASRKALRDSS